MDPVALRSQFPVCERLAYLNAGTDGPVATAAIAAAQEALAAQAAEGRARAHFDQRMELGARLRSAYAALLGCDTDDVALTTCTTEGMATVIAGLDLRPGEEIVTSDQEHPGLLGALQAARDLKGVTITTAPFARVHEAVSSKTALVAMSHVSWVGGEVAPAELAGVDVPVLLDGAQGVGAVPVDVGAIGADAYAGAGQKWLCGPDGTGMLAISAALRERVVPITRGYMSFEDPGSGLEASLRAEARRYDTPSLSREACAFALSAHAVLDRHGWGDVHARARDLASILADRLRESGRDVAPRGSTTLVSWRSEDGEADRARLLAAGVLVRDIPGRGLLRASVGAWNTEDDLERLLAAL